LGLGAARVASNAETFGLSLYSGLLGRLNGKSEAEVEKQQTAQRDVELALYQGRKYGNINFISAGFLVGDKMDLKSTVMPNSKPASEKTAPDAANKKRKRSEPLSTCSFELAVSVTPAISRALQACLSFLFPIF